MASFIDWTGFLGGLVLVTVAALALYAFSALPFWGCLLIALFGVLVNGWFATWEDEQPGGFNNPTEPPSSH